MPFLHVLGPVGRIEAAAPAVGGQGSDRLRRMEQQTGAGSLAERATGVPR